MRTCVLQAPNAASLLFADEFEQWESTSNLKIFTGTRETFEDLFDEDETLTYEPETTAAIILTGGDEDAEQAALEVEAHTSISQYTQSIPHLVPKDETMALVSQLDH